MRSKCGRESATPPRVANEDIVSTDSFQYGLVLQDQILRNTRNRSPQIGSIGTLLPFQSAIPLRSRWESPAS